VTTSRKFSVGQNVAKMVGAISSEVVLYYESKNCTNLFSQ